MTAPKAVLFATMLWQLSARAEAASATVSFAVTGQPNIAVIFKDIDLATCGPEVIGSVFNELSGEVLEATLTCTASGVAVVYNGATVELEAGAATRWVFNAADDVGLKWQTKAELLDIM